MVSTIIGTQHIIVNVNNNKKLKTFGPWKGVNPVCFCDLWMTSLFMCVLFFTHIYGIRTLHLCVASQTDGAQITFTDVLCISLTKTLYT